MSIDEWDQWSGRARADWRGEYAATWRTFRSIAVGRLAIERRMWAMYRRLLRIELAQVATCPGGAHADAVIWYASEGERAAVGIRHYLDRIKDADEKIAELTRPPERVVKTTGGLRDLGKCPKCDRKRCVCKHADGGV